MMSRQRRPEGTQESVWDYPRPPRVDQPGKRVQVVFNGVVIADSTRAQRVLEWSHPPVYYIPPGDVRMQYLRTSDRRTVCEWKGTASYYDVAVGDRSAANAAWTYHQPDERYPDLASHIAFYPAAMDACLVDGERVRPEPGDFYGGWITDDIRL